jgi:hypothetical protein
MVPPSHVRMELTLQVGADDARANPQFWPVVRSSKNDHKLIEGLHGHKARVRDHFVFSLERKSASDPLHGSCQSPPV